MKQVFEFLRIQQHDVYVPLVFFAVFGPGLERPRERRVKGVRWHDEAETLIGPQ